METGPAAEERDWFVPAKGAGLRRDTVPPAYVQSMDKSGIEALQDWSWLDFGIEQRTRFDRRDDSYLQPELKADDQFLMRTRTYFGVKEIFDPFRFVLEFQDSRQFNSEFPENTRDVDEADFLQAFGELYFKDALGDGRPLRFQAGRMTLEYADRRFVGRNVFRNTTNSFEGFRMQMGERRSDWQFDFFAVQPVQRFLTAHDRPDEERWLYGLVGAWRRWPSVITLEPYYFISDEDRKDPDSADRELHTLGLHGYGPIAKTGFDYDFSAALQTGEDAQRDIHAFGLNGQIGRNFDVPWKPRLAVWCNYASGDRTPDDSLNERLDPMFTDSHSAYGYSDMFTWSNMINPTLHFALKPTDKLSIDTFYRAFWLASDSDAWVPIGRRDATGTSGDFVGQEIDLGLVYKFSRRFEVELGYAHFMPGAFVQNTGPADDTDVFYVQTFLRF